MLTFISCAYEEPHIGFNAGAKGPWKRMLQSKLEGIFPGHFKARAWGSINLLDKSQV